MMDIVSSGLAGCLVMQDTVEVFSTEHDFSVFASGKPVRDYVPVVTLVRPPGLKKAAVVISCCVGGSLTPSPGRD